MNEKISSNFQAHPSQVALAKLFSSVVLLGPPLDERLIRLVSHLFSPEEAEIARHLPFYIPKPIEKIAKKARRAVQEIEPFLEIMVERRVIFKRGGGYFLLPIVPGMFEVMLMDGRDSEWHRKYAQLFNELYSTGYMRRYTKTTVAGIRNIPVQKSIEGKSRVVDADYISEMIDQHKALAVLNVCQCRQSMRFIGKECKRSSPKDGCLVFGSFAINAVADGNGRAVSKGEMKEIVNERWEKKLVFFTGNVLPQSPNAICTCCDCCCHFLRIVNQYEGRVFLASSHFLAEVDGSLCNDCGKCAGVCNTYAHSFVGKKHHFDQEKCIGCGLCISFCKENAIKMVENPSYRKPAKDFKALGRRLLPYLVLSGIKAKFTKI